MSEDDYEYALRLAEVPGQRPRATWSCPTGLSPGNVRLVCEALIEAYQDKARLTKLIDLGNHCEDPWFSDHVWDLAEGIDVPEEYADDPQYIIRAVIDWEMEQ